HVAAGLCYPRPGGCQGRLSGPQPRQVESEEERRARQVAAQGQCQGGQQLTTALAGIQDRAEWHIGQGEYAKEAPAEDEHPEGPAGRGALWSGASQSRRARLSRDCHAERMRLPAVGLFELPPEARLEHLVAVVEE